MECFHILIQLCETSAVDIHACDMQIHVQTLM